MTKVVNVFSQIETPSEGSLIISPVHMDDSGFYECRVSNGIGETQSAVAYLNVECKLSDFHSLIVTLITRLNGMRDNKEITAKQICAVVYIHTVAAQCTYIFVTNKYNRTIFNIIAQKGN